MKHFWRSKPLAVGAACVIAMTGLAGGAGGAMAADHPSIDKDTGSLTVHKLAQPNTQPEHGTGLEDKSIQGDPIDGIEFDVIPLNGIDLKTNAGWTDLKGAVKAVEDGSALPGTITEGTPVKQTTASDGIATFADLPVGAYKVEEKLTTEQMQKYTGVAPFVVTIPMTHPTDLNKWVYDVHVYPKNDVRSAKKAVKDAAANFMGSSDVVWNVTTSIPGGEATDLYRVTDQLDPKLTYKSATVTIGGKSAEQADYTVKAEGQAFTMELTEAGRAKALAAIKADKAAKVVTTIVTRVNAAGEINNQAMFYPNAASVENGGTPTDIPQTKFGGVKLHKTGQENKPLEGAEFAVYASSTNDFKTATEIIKAKATDQDGSVTFDGLRYSNFADGAAVEKGATGYMYYWLVETKAPTGYELLAEPIQFDVAGQLASATAIEVKNVPAHGGGFLPRTGSTGFYVLIVAGILVAAGGALVAARSARKAD